jgi:phenylalanyl-tRNA synthetase alpha subunit
MMGLLSIEQLTGAIVAPQIAIAGGAAQSRQGASELVRSQMAQGYSEAKAKAKEKQEALDAAKAQSVSATGNVNGIKSSQPVDSEKLRQAEATQAAAEAAFKSAQKERDLADAKEAVYKEGFEKSLSGLDTMVAGGSAQTLQSYQARLGNDFAKMADTVREIVETVVNKALVADECFLAVTEVASLAAARTAPNASEIVPLITAEMDKCNRLGLEQALNKLKVDALSTSAEQQKNEIDSLRKKLAAGEADAKKVKELEDKLDKAKNEFKSITSDIQRAANEASNAAKQSKADVLPESGRAVPSPQK